MLWQPSGRSRTPNTVWRPPGALPPPHPNPERPYGWRSTLRSTLDGNNARPKTSPATACASLSYEQGDAFSMGGGLEDSSAVVDRPTTAAPECFEQPFPSRSFSSFMVFEGDWVSRTDGELRGRIEGASLIWEEDCSTTHLWAHGERGDVISMLVDGECHSGVLSEDGRLLRWGDGDTWIRMLPENALDHKLRDLGSAGLELDETLPWAGWSTRLMPASGRPTFKSAACAAFTSYSSLSVGGTILRPSAVFL